MLHPSRSPLAPVAGARSSRIDRAAMLFLGLVLVFCFGLAILTAGQLDALEHEDIPALVDAKRLDTTVATLGLALRRADLDRADSLAAGFHALANQSRASDRKRKEMQRYASSFADYYVSARRAAAGTSMSEEADLSSAESARLAAGVLDERLRDGIAAASLAVERSPLATMRIRLAASVLVALSATVALILLLPRGAKGRDRQVELLPERRPDVATPLDREREHGHLQEAVRRMAQRRQSVAAAAAQVAERNRQQVELLERLGSPALTVIRGEQPKVSRTPVNASYALGQRAIAGV